MFSPSTLTKINVIEKENSKDYLIMQIILMMLCIVIRVPQIQRVFLIYNNLILVGYMGKRFEIESKLLTNISILLLGLNIFLVFLTYFNAIYLGFSDGIVHGMLNGENHSDNWQYFYESKQLAQYWKKGLFSNWIKGELTTNIHYYGFYNFFVIFNGILHLLFGSDYLVFILFKLQLSIISIFLLYDITKYFLKFKYSILTILLMNLYPGFLFVNSILVRDNIIYFFVLLISRRIIIAKIDGKSKGVWFKFFLIIGIITYLRIYLGVVLGVSLVIYYFYGKVSIKKSIMGLFILIIVILLVGKITEVMGYGFFGSKILSNQEQTLSRWHANKASSISKIVFWSLYTTFAGGRIWSKNIFFNCINDFINGISPLYITLFIFPSLFSLLLFDKTKDKDFYIFSLAFSISSGLVIFYIWTAIIPRLYICWIWSQFILLACLLQYLEGVRMRMKSAVLFQYIAYLIFVLSVYIKY